MPTLARLVLLSLLTLGVFAGEKVNVPLLKKVAQAYFAKEPASGIPAGLGYEEALRWQKEFVSLLVPKLGAPAGYKAGLVTPAGQKRFGLTHPVRGVLLRKMLLPNNSTVAVHLGTRPIVEADLIVRVKDDGINNATTMEEAARHLSEVITFIELADNIFATNAPTDGGMLVAGNVGARAGILGEARPIETTQEFIRAFGEMAIVLERDGKEVSRVKADGVLGHPLNAVLWLVQDMKKTGERLKAGDLLSLGSPSPQENPKAGEHYRLTYEGLPGGPMHASVHLQAP